MFRSDTYFLMNGRALGSLLSTRNVAIEAIPQITGLSIIPVVAKVFERIVYDKVYRYLTENKPWRHEKLSGIV